MGRVDYIRYLRFCLDFSCGSLSMNNKCLYLKKKYKYLNRLNVGWWYFPLSDNYSTTTKWIFEPIIYYVVKKNILYFCIFTKIHFDTKKLVTHLWEERDTILYFLIENCFCGYVRVIVVFRLTLTPIYVNLGKE